MGFKSSNASISLVMPGIDSDELPNLTEVRRAIKERVLNAIGELGQLDVQDLTQARIIAALLTGQRTVSELVEEIYGQRRGDEGYMGSYSKIRRAVMVLASHGYVSTKLFGKDKPYRLTKYAVANLADISDSTGKPRIIPRVDLIIHGVTVIMGLVALSLVVERISLGSGPAFALFYAALFTLLGASIVRLLESVSKVM